MTLETENIKDQVTFFVTNLGLQLVTILLVSHPCAVSHDILLEHYTQILGVLKGFCTHTCEVNY
jgi:hypothetical protein